MTISTMQLVGQQQAVPVNGIEVAVCNTAALVCRTLLLARRCSAGALGGSLKQKQTEKPTMKLITKTSCVLTGAKLKMSKASIRMQKRARAAQAVADAYAARH